MVKVYTGKFKDCIEHLSRGLTLISIDKSIPKNYKELIHYSIDELKPSWAMAKKSEQEQATAYARKLSKLNPRDIAKQIQRIIKDENSKGAILLTFGKRTRYSSRKQVGDWLSKYTRVRPSEYKLKIIKIDQKLLTDD
jgi:rubrerythrin